MSSITLKVNQANLVQSLRHAFTNKSTVLAELMQNARRAGATEVRFDQANGKLIVVDNGSGIEDLQNLFTVAESGWDDATKQVEKPYGLGFFSALYAADKVTVESLGKMVSFQTEDVLSFGTIPTLDTDFAAGTRITLEGINLGSNIGIDLKGFAEGYAIPVYLNGVELPRPRALKNLQTIDSAVGPIHIVGLHQDDPAVLHDTFIAYLQGIKVYATHGYAPGGYNVVHLDSSKFVGRMPDRNTLIDAEEAAKAIRDVIHAELRKLLTSKLEFLGSRTFAEQYWDAMQRLGFYDMINDLDYIPSCALYKAPYPDQRNDRFCKRPAVGVTRNQIERGEVVLCEGCVDEETAPSHMVAYVLNWLTTSLPAKHWAKPFVLDLDSADTGVTVNGLEEFSPKLDGHCAWGPVRFCESMSLTLTEKNDLGPAGSPRQFTVEVSDQALAHEGGFLIPSGVTPSGASEVVVQVSSYSSDDIYQETEYDQDTDEMCQIVKAHRANDPVALLKELLAEVDIKRFKLLHNAQFTIAVNDHGELNVTAAAA